MTRDDIIRMAREAGYQHPDAVGTCEDFAYFDLARFAALVAAAERLAQPEKPTADEIIASHAKRLALELEGVLLECEETSATSKWWGSAYQAIHNFHDDVDRLYPQDHVSPLGKD